MLPHGSLTYRTQPHSMMVDPIGAPSHPMVLVTPSGAPIAPPWVPSPPPWFCPHASHPPAMGLSTPRRGFAPLPVLRGGVDAVGPVRGAGAATRRAGDDPAPVPRLLQGTESTGGDWEGAEWGGWGGTWGSGGHLSPTQCPRVLPMSPKRDPNSRGDTQEGRWGVVSAIVAGAPQDRGVLWVAVGHPRVPCAPPDVPTYVCPPPNLVPSEGAPAGDHDAVAGRLHALLLLHAGRQAARASRPTVGP